MARRAARSPKNSSPPRPTSALERSGYRLNDDAVERALVSGEDRDLLEELLGERGYLELRALAAKSGTRGRVRGPRVLVLPGLMGSKLGRRGGLFDEAIWFDPLDVARGKLELLALRGRSAGVEPLGVMLFAYLKLKLVLKVEGFDADFHAFDWRKGLPELGRELARRIEKEAREHGVVDLVAHSMGGLVSRAALGELGARKRDLVRRLVMLGTPNHGSFASVQALRGTLSTVRKIAALDVMHSAEWLADNVFATFPGLVQMLPFAARLPELELYERRTWPASGPRPTAALLRAAPGAQEALAKGDESMVLVAGVGAETVVGLSRTAAGFEYRSSEAGDGTVPLELARLEGVRTYYCEESHGSLPSNGAVGRAVVEILERGETSELLESWTSRRRGTLRREPEDELREAPFDGRTGARISVAERRAILSDLVAPVGDVAHPELLPGTAMRFQGTSSEPIIVGRRRQQRLDLNLALGSITQVDAQALVMGLFQDVAPTGPARAIDEALDGAVTDFTRRRMMSGKVGEVFIMPTGRHRIRAEFVVFVGLGPFDRFTDEILRLAAENVVRALTRTKVRDMATVVIGSGSVTTLSDSLSCMLQGSIEGLRDSGELVRLRSITLCEYDPGRYREMKSEILRLATTTLFDEVEVTVTEILLPPEPEVEEAREEARRRAARVASGAIPAVDPIYLITRKEGQGLRASILTSGAKATVMSEVVPLKWKDLHEYLEWIEEDWFDHSTVAEFGAELAQMVLPESILAALSKLRDHQIIVVHDAPTSTVPWETLSIRRWMPAGREGISRKYAADDLSVAKWLDERRHGKVLDLLLVINPTGDLDGAEAEGERVQRLFDSNPAVRVKSLRGKEATWTALRAEIRSGSYDVLHYAGHAQFVPSDREQSGIVCYGDHVLSGQDLAGLSKLPALVFFNACEASRIGAATDPRRRRDVNRRIEENLGLAEAFLRGGVANYVGTYWPVGDAAAKVFSDHFYTALLEGKSIGNSLGEGRTAVKRIPSADWTDYVHYGSPEFVLKNAD